MTADVVIDIASSVGDRKDLRTDADRFPGGWLDH